MYYTIAWWLGVRDWAGLRLILVVQNLHTSWARSKLTQKTNVIIHPDRDSLCTNLGSSVPKSMAALSGSCVGVKRMGGLWMSAME